METNRVELAILKCKDQIAKNLAEGRTTAAKVLTAHRAADMDLAEYVMFQEMKSAYSGSAVLSIDEAMTVYRYLGNTVEFFNKQPIEVKHVLTEVFMVLLKYRLRNRAA